MLRRVAAQVGGGEGKGGVGRGAPARAGVGPGADDEDRAVVVVRRLLRVYAAVALARRVAAERAARRARKEVDRRGSWWRSGGPKPSMCAHGRSCAQAWPGVASAETPGAGDEPAVVPGGVGIEPDRGVGEPWRRCPAASVPWCEVEVDVLFGDLCAAESVGDGERADVQALLDHPAVRPVGVRVGTNRGGAGRCLEQLVQQLGSGPDRRWQDRGRVGRRRSAVPSRLDGPVRPAPPDAPIPEPRPAARPQHPPRLTSTGREHRPRAHPGPVRSNDLR
jgi:hypothetical protein